ncbi:MAG: hypothetical protein AB1742_11425 [bacterium]
MKKLSLYIETSVWNFMFADHVPDKRESTRKFFNEVESGKYELYVSETVIMEIMDAPPEIGKKLLESIRRYSPVMFYRDRETDSLAEAYIEGGLLGKETFQRRTSPRVCFRQ